jgi:hypothetical protein
MQLKLSFVSLSISALLMVSVIAPMTTTIQAFAQAQPPRPDPNQPGNSNIKLIGTPTVDKTEPYDPVTGLAEFSFLTVTGVTSGGGGTAVLSYNYNYLTACVDDETGEHVFTGSVNNIPATSDPVTIQSGKNQPFIITTDTLTSADVPLRLMSNAQKEAIQSLTLCNIQTSS